MPSPLPSYLFHNQIFALKFNLNDQNPAGAKEKTYQMKIQIWDPPKITYNRTFIPKLNLNRTEINRQTLKVYVKEMNSQGLLTLRFSEDVKNISVINDTVLYIRVRDHPFSSGNKTILTWNTTRLDKRELDIQLYFAEPGDLSTDKVIVLANNCSIDQG